MNIDLNVRQNQLTSLQNYLNDVDTEVTMILQNLQWDRKHLLEQKPMVACKYDKGHSVPPDKLVEHETRCFWKSQGYTETDRSLPSPIDPDAATLVKLSTDNIREIINTASLSQPLFRRGAGCSGPQPLTLERLQATYTPDERRAIHDAVVNQVPSSHNLSELALISSKDSDGKESKSKSKLEVLAEMRDMRRRRTKYRAAAKTRAYSGVLREIIAAQMEVYTQVHTAESDQLSVNSGNTDSNSKPSDDRPQGKPPRHSRHHERYEIRSGHTDARHEYTSSRASKRQELHESVPRKINQYKGDVRRDNATNRRDTDHTRSETINRKRRKYDRHESRHRYRDKDNSNRTKDKSKESSNDYRKLKDKHDNYERHHGHRERQHYDSYRDKGIGHKSKDDVNSKERYKCKEQQAQIVRIKKEKEDSYTDDSNSSEDDATEYSDKSSHKHNKYYSSKQRLKKEKGVYVKKEGNSSGDGGANYFGKSTEIRSEILSNEQSNSTGCIDKCKYNEKNKDRTSNQEQQEPERRDTMVQNIKREKVDI